MNEFDDLFSKDPKIEEKPLNNAAEDLNQYVNKREKNGLLLTVYIIVSLIISFGVSLLTQKMYPDMDAILGNITEIQELNIIVEDNNSVQYPYNFIITGELKNTNDILLQQLFIEIDFLDEAGEVIYTYKYFEENIEPDGILSIDTEVQTDFTFASYEARYGINFNGKTQTLLNLLPVLLCAFIFFYIDKECFIADAKEFKRNSKKYLSQTFIGIVMVIASLYVANLLMMVLGVTGTSQNEMAIQNLFSGDTVQLILLFFLLCIFTPIVEEVIFRKVIYNFIEPRTNKYVAVILTGAIFGLMHVVAFGDFIQSIPYIFMGITFGYIYYRSNKNIFVTILVHFLNNFISFVVYTSAIILGTII